jgi:alpha-galactosidase
MPKICFLGAGSWFAEPLCTDVMLTPTLSDGSFRLVDIDEHRLNLSARLIAKIADHIGSSWTVETFTDHRAALSGCDYIINCIEVSGIECVRHDSDIPLKYGVSQCIGDTIGPGGLFKGLRTIPVWLDILRDCERLCPDAWVLNYTNPMNMMCLAAARTSKMKVIGLCHSVQGTSRQLADYVDIPYEELEWQCAGINHLAWFTTLRHAGEDLYPRLEQRLRDDAPLFERDPVRFDVMRHFGAFVTESSGHLSEYLPYYRKRPDLIATYCRAEYLGQESFYADNWPQWRREADERREKMLDGRQPLGRPSRSTEYASYIIEARENDRPYRVHGNVINNGLIDNLPAEGCVEVACTVGRTGIHPKPFGPLPPQMAALCASNMAMFDLGATAAIERNPEAAVHALMLDPLTAAVCSPAEIRQMAAEMFRAQTEFLPGFESGSRAARVAIPPASEPIQRPAAAATEHN